MTTTQHAYPGGLYTTTNITVSGAGREGANVERLEMRGLDGQRVARAKRIPREGA